MLDVCQVAVAGKRGRMFTGTLDLIRQCKLIVSLLCYNSTKIDRPRLTLLVGLHAVLCKPNQDPAQLRLSLDQTAPPLLRQFSDDFSLIFRSVFSVQSIWIQKMSL